ncbi:hypothetical protein H2248_010722 [Termitomyces sp. 'cryptogamus']|nr:hypothetical protein H2248_010722 [Termitomyces sp. 'cryptogamus']
MGRPTIYHTPEQKRAAHNAKSRKNYAKNRDIIRVRRMIQRERKSLIERLEVEIEIRDLAASALRDRGSSSKTEDGDAPGAGMQPTHGDTKDGDTHMPGDIEIDHEMLFKWSNGLMTTKHLVGSLDPAHMRGYVTYLKQQQRRQYNREQRFNYVVFPPPL